MGLIEIVRRWLHGRLPKRPPPDNHPHPRSQDEDDEIAELIAIDII